MIDTQAIRSKILDLAMRGQLTEQLPEDGTAEELYQQIQEEKQKLIKEGKIKKEKILPDITNNDIPFEIPNNWKWIRWGSLSYQIHYGYNAPAKSSGRIKMVRITDIQGNKVLWGNVPYCDIDEDSIDDYRLQHNNILFARTGGTVGKSYLVENIEEEAVFAGYLIRTSFSDCLSAKYMKYFMDSHLYWKQLQDGTTAFAQPNCNAKTLSKMLCPLPPYEEQQRIVEMISLSFNVLDTIDELQTQYADNLTALKSKLIDAAIQGKLTEQFPEDGTAEELYQQIQIVKQKRIASGEIKRVKSLPEITTNDSLFSIPSNWRWCMLESLYNFIDYRGATPQKIKEGIPFVTAKNVRQGYTDYTVKEYISEEDYLKRQSRGISHKGDLLFTTEAPMGYAAIADLDVFSAGQRLITLQQYTEKPLIENKYYMYAISARFFQKQLDEKCSGTTVKGIKADRLKMFLVPLPPLAEQKRIVQKLEEILPLCEIQK